MGVTEDLKRHASRWYKLLEEWAYTRDYLERKKRRERDLILSQIGDNIESNDITIFE